MAKLKDITGQKFGRWLIIEQAVSGDQGANWLCRCDCGVEKIVNGKNLRSGVTRSCGCFRKELLTTHGLKKSPEYMVWANMKDRCQNKNTDGYKYYGARGIVVCEEWRNDFAAFYRDMGPRPEGRTPKGWPMFSVERKDKDGPYSKENCYWATWHEQRINSNAGRKKRVSLVTVL